MSVFPAGKGSGESSRHGKSMFKVLKTRGLFILRVDCLFPWHG